ALAVQVRHVPLVDRGGVDLHAGVEGLVHHLAGQHVLQRGADEGAALAGLDVLEVHNGPQLAVEVEHQPVLQVVGGGHDVLCSYRATRSLPVRVSSSGPSARTTSVSSMRTPPRPGRYTPGSTVTGVSSASVPAPNDDNVGASWTSSPTPCPSP